MKPGSVNILGKTYKIEYVDRPSTDDDWCGIIDVVSKRKERRKR